MTSKQNWTSNIVLGIHHTLLEMLIAKEIATYMLKVLGKVTI